ncbi:discoidin domain-containing protein [Agriterribacter sp.]|uniref:galactose-binding domain-containing protein n=1 Tax=Agriterribacter sp. TaxID=2821509 RepID=UPI002C45D2CD|nr:discoidin domain-containing protein [Agriterribacter sp.]HRO47061.1 discoidin domain-containing protein [Agriterribacter sp.]HRQ19027.1 discoidin domain-containing protein [Agriterribacter sp.]
MTLKIYPLFFLFFISLLLAGTTTAQTNIALGKNAYSSSDESGALLPVNVTDGNYGTRWASTYADNQWIYIDLGQQYDFTEVKLFWETALGRDFNIEVSDDALGWTVAAGITGNISLNNTMDISSFSGRFIRMHGLVRGTAWGFSLYELEVYGTPAVSVPVVNLAYLKTGTSSSNENGNNIPVWAFDGLGTNVINGKARDGNNVEYRRWSSVYNNDEWIAVDLGASYEITEVKLYWEVANGNSFNIEVSPDGTNWSVAASITGNTSTQYINDIIINPSVSGRHVRMHGITRNTGYGYSLYEFEVFGLNTILPIVLTDFRAVKKDRSVQLTWNAGMDKESRFNIQRSGNGADFTTIGTLYYPSGTNGISSSYGFKDESPLPGVNYYRLAYTETGEKTLYSDVLSVRFTEERNFVVSPNPVAGNIIRVELDRAVQNKLTLRLLTITGKIIEQQEVSANSKIAELKLNKHLSAGTYVLQVLEGNQPVRSRQILINR